MSSASVLLLIVIAAAVVAFSLDLDWLPADVVALGLLVALVLSGILPPEIAFSGFGNEAVLMILGLLVMTVGLSRTGVVALVGQWVVRRIGDRPDRLLPMIMGSSAGLSAFMSNTGATAFFLPIVLSLSRTLKVSASKLLMPLAFATILASSVTLIGTSTNIVVSGIMTTYGLPPLGMFELSIVGVPILLVGLVYMLTLGRKLIPDRALPESDLGVANLRPYLFEMVIPENSEFVGQDLAQLQLGAQFDVNVLRIVRAGEEIMMPSSDLVLQAGDLALVEGERDRILQLETFSGLKLDRERELGRDELESTGIGVYEVVLMPRSPMLHRSLAEMSFRERYGLQALGIHHQGSARYGKLSGTKLEAGDQLLVRGHRENVQALEEEGLFRMLQNVPWSPPNRRQAIMCASIFVGVIVAASVNLLPLPVAVVLGMFLVFATRCITPEQAYREVQWSTIILVGSMLSLGFALENTGTASYLASLIGELAAGMPPIYLLGGFFALTMLLTQPMSNQAASIVVVPLAIQTSLQLGLNPRPFVVIIALGASCSFLTPLEPACLLVYGPGNYRFMDFFKVGVLLTGIVMMLSLLLVPVAWPLGG